MYQLTLALTAAFLLLAGCGSTPAEAPLAQDHPANPHATEALATPPSQVLASHDDVQRTQTQQMPPMHDGMHGTHGSMHPAPAATTQAAVYTCPMHPEVVSDKPGKCPKCGMNLVKKGEAR